MRSEIENNSGFELSVSIKVILFRTNFVEHRFDNKFKIILGS